MVEVTSKPTDISKIQDIMNAISSNGGSDKTGLMVDYAAGSKLESGINELKMIGKEQAVYLKKMVGYQEAMLGKARREDVSSAATPSKKGKKDNDEEESKSASLGSILATAGSAGLMSLLGPLGLQAAAGILLRGGGGVDKVRGGGGADRLAASAAAEAKLAKTASAEAKLAKTANLAKDLIKVSGSAAEDFFLGAFKLTEEMLVKGISGSGDFELTSKSPLILYKDPVKSPLKLTEAMRKVISGSGNFELGDAKSLLNLSEEMLVKPKIPPVSVAAEESSILKKLLKLGGKGAGLLGTILKPLANPITSTAIGAGRGFFDKELKDAKIATGGRMIEGILESVPGTIDLITQYGINSTINTYGNMLKLALNKMGVDTSKVGKMSIPEITPTFRKFMIDNVLRTEEEVAAAMGRDIRSISNDVYGIDRDRQRISRNAPDLQVPSKAPTSQAAPIIIAPPAAPASSVVNSNNQQTTIVNQTKPVSASLYMHMLGGD